MSDTPDEQLESQLRELTAWPDPAPNLWRRALAAAGSVDHEGIVGRRPLLGRRVPGWAVASLGVAAAILVVTVGILTTETITQSRKATTAQPAAIAALGEPAQRSTDSLARRGGTLRSTRGGVGAFNEAWDRAAPAARHGVGADGRFGGLGYVSGGGTGRVGTEGVAAPSTEGVGQLSAERHVIRKATIELVTEDVRAVFLKAALLISEAKGEYVQDSGITGSGEKMQANLTLRVVAERLPEVLNELRQLGEVRSEKTTGEDVTTQVVDLEARLRNEQRVETELLQLLEKREDSPLKEILELRRTIADVRQSIERLTAQRERLSRLVSLATVLVIIRPADAPPPAEPEEPGLGAYFIDALGGAWHKGTTFLVNTFAGFVSVLIGGLIWWILLIAVILLVRSYRRRTAAAA